MALALGFFLFGFFFQFRSVFLSHLSLVPGDLGDPRLNQMILENLHQWLSGSFPYRKLLDLPFYYPSLGVGAWTDTLWGAIPFYSIFRIVGVDSESSYTAWILLLSTLNYFCAYYSLRCQFKFKNPSAIAGAFLFAFGLPRLAQIGHAQLYPAFITPLFFGYLFLALEKFPSLKKKEFSFALLALIYQIYCGFYLGWFLCFLLVVGAIVLFIQKSTRVQTLEMIKTNFVYLGLCALGSAFLLLPQLLPFFESAKIFGPRPYSYVRTTFPRLLSYLHVGKESIFESWISHLSGANEMSATHEHKMGVGLLTSVLIFLGFQKGRRERDLASLVSGKLSLVLILFSISFFSVSLWGLIYLFFPGGSAIRVVSRIILTLLFLYSIGLAQFLNTLQSKIQWILVTVICIEQLCTIPTYSKSVNEMRLSALSALIPTQCEVFYGIKNGPAQARDEFQLDAIWVAFRRNIKTLNGYYGHDANHWDLSPGSREKLEAWEQLHHFKVDRNCVFTAPDS